MQAMHVTDIRRLYSRTSAIRKDLIQLGLSAFHWRDRVAAMVQHIRIGSRQGTHVPCTVTESVKITASCL